VRLAPRKIVFTGGEPLLRADILELLAGLRAADADRKVLCCLNTNGHLVTEKLARDLVGLVDEVRVSLDALPKRNDALRGEGNFDSALRALECFHSVGFEPKVLVTVTSESLPDLEELICLLVSMKFTRINLNGFRPIGRGSKRSELVADLDMTRNSVSRAWNRCFPNDPRSHKCPSPEEQSHCGVGSFLNIMPDGDVFPCHVLTYSEFRCGNVRHQSLYEICRRVGLLGQLVALDFRGLAPQHPLLAPLTLPHTCMGNVYRKTRSLPIWRRNLPALLSSDP